MHNLLYFIRTWLIKQDRLNNDLTKSLRILRLMNLVDIPSVQVVAYQPLAITVETLDSSSMFID